MTLILAVTFTAYQGLEYIEAPFTISDGIYGTTFFFSTGFHGLHVIIGTAFLATQFIRFINYQVTDHHHLGFEGAALY
jgi:cytochrome c oxidase subunit 3